MPRERRSFCCLQTTAWLALCRVICLAAVSGGLGEGRRESNASVWRAPTDSVRRSGSDAAKETTPGGPISNATAGSESAVDLKQVKREGRQEHRVGATVQTLSDEPTPENMFTPAKEGIQRNSSDKCPPGMVGSCNECYCCCSTPPFMGLTFTQYIPEACGCITKMHGSMAAVLVIASLAFVASVVGSCWFSRRCCWQPFREPGSRAQREFAQSRQERYYGGGMDQFLA